MECLRIAFFAVPFVLGRQWGQGSTGMSKSAPHAHVMYKGGALDPEEIHTRLRKLVEELGESRGPASLGPNEGGTPPRLPSASAANGALAKGGNKSSEKPLTLEPSSSLAQVCRR